MENDSKATRVEFAGTGKYSYWKLQICLLEISITRICNYFVNIFLKVF